MDLITPDVGLVFWSFVTFTLLLLLLKKFAWVPILSAVNKREASVREALVSAEKARQETHNLQMRNKSLLDEARQERDTILTQAKKNKVDIIASAKEEAEAEANKVMANAKIAIDRQRQEAIKTIKLQVAEMAIDISEKIIVEEFSDKRKQLEKVQELMKEFSLN